MTFRTPPMNIPLDWPDVSAIHGISESGARCDVVSSPPPARAWVGQTMRPEDVAACGPASGIRSFR